MKKDLFGEMIGNLDQAVAYKKGNAKAARITRIAVPADIDVKAIRTKLKMTQETFAITFGFSLSGLKKWELKVREPEGAARTLLHMIDKDAKAVLKLAR